MSSITDTEKIWMVEMTAERLLTLDVGKKLRRVHSTKEKHCVVVKYVDTRQEMLQNSNSLTRNTLLQAFGESGVQICGKTTRGKVLQGVNG